MFEKTLILLAKCLLIFATVTSLLMLGVMFYYGSMDSEEIKKERDLQMFQKYDKKNIEYGKAIYRERIIK